MNDTQRTLLIAALLASASPSVANAAAAAAGSQGVAAFAVAPRPFVTTTPPTATTADAAAPFSRCGFGSSSSSTAAPSTSTSMTPLSRATYLQVAASVTSSSGDESNESPPATAASSSSNLMNEATAATDANGATIMPNEDEIDFDWQALSTKVFAEGDTRPIILFDGVCNLCNGGINFAMDQDESGKFRFASLQSKVGQALLLRIGKSQYDISTIILMESSTDAYFSSDAVARICAELDAVPLQVLGKLGQITPSFIREAVYQVISQNRYQFGEYDSCRIDFDGTLTSRFVQDPDDVEHRLI